MHFNTRRQLLLLFLVAMSALACLGDRVCFAQNRQVAHVYVKMDFTSPIGSQTAEAWHFDPNNNGAWTQLSNWPVEGVEDYPSAQFEVQDLFDSNQIGPWVWFLRVNSVAVKKGDPGNFTDVSNQPAYSQMVDFLAMGFDGRASSLVPIDPCGNRIWPIAVGSSLTPYDLWYPPERSLGMRMVKEELLGVVVRQWQNPAGVEEEDVYLDLGLMFDIQEGSPPGYTNLCVTWVSAGGGCGYDFCLNSNQQVTKTGTPVDVFDNGAAFTVRGAVPLVLDHTSSIKLYTRNDNNDSLLVTRYPSNSNNFYSAHQCRPDGAEVEWHSHSSGSAGHLQAGGLSPWFGNEDFGVDTTLFTEAVFTIPTHETFDPFHTVATPINCRAVYMVFIECSGPQE